MFEDLKNSVNKTLNDRIKSPFYGSFIISWVIWNWRIVYLTFFVSEDKIKSTKLLYIIDNYLLVNRLFWLPFASSILLIVFGPWLNIFSKWLHLWYEQIRIRQNQKIVRTQLLSLEESIELREQMLKDRDEYTSINEKYNKRIKELEIELEKHGVKQEGSVSITSDKELEELAKKIMSDPNELRMFTELLKSIQGGYRFNSDIINPLFIFKLEANGIVHPTQPGVYKLLTNGIKLQKMISS